MYVHNLNLILYMTYYMIYFGRNKSYIFYVLLSEYGSGEHKKSMVRGWFGLLIYIYCHIIIYYYINYYMIWLTYTMLSYLLKIVRALYKLNWYIEATYNL